MGFNMINQALSIFLQIEEIRFLSCLLNWPAAVRTFPINKLAFSPEGLTWRTIQAFIFTFVNITLFVKLFKALQ